MKLLYITRKYPPTVGGMETVAYELYEALKGRADVRLVAIRSKHGGKSVLLPLLYLGLFVRAIWAGVSSRPDCVYIQDGVLGPLGWLLRVLLRLPVVVTIHGTEVAYQNPVYRKIVLPFLGRVTAGVAISSGTQELAQRVLPKLPLQTVHWGVRDEFYVDQPVAALRRELEQALNVSLGNRPFAYLCGRLIERKGALWFVRNIASELKQQVPNVVCVIAGEGQDAAAVRAAITELGLQDTVYLVNYARGARRGQLYSAADVFVMPNIKAYGFEGFGVVAIEASSCGTPVVASRIDGITDAVIDGQTGYLLQPGDAAAFVQTIAQSLTNPAVTRASVRATTLQQYNWDKTAEQYLAVFSSVSS